MQASPRSADTASGGPACRCLRCRRCSRRPPTPAESPGSAIYVRGGGYVGEIQAEHWNLISGIACETGKPVHVPIYGLASEHHAAEAITPIKAVMTDASASGPVYLAGDSAGAGLALAVTIDWLADGLKALPPVDLYMGTRAIAADPRRPGCPKFITTIAAQSFSYAVARLGC